MTLDDTKNEMRGSNCKENSLMTSQEGFSSDPESKSKPEVDSKDEDTFENFTGYTTLHGLRFIGDNNSVVPRRFLWLLLVLMCGTLFSLQVYDRVSYFMTSPITVNFKVNYNKTVAFPAITICNQNNFRRHKSVKVTFLTFTTFNKDNSRYEDLDDYSKPVAYLTVRTCNQDNSKVSKAYKSKWLQYIMSIYGNDKGNLHLLPTTPIESLNMNVSELFEGLAHSKEDFIVKCEWKNERCSADNFTRTLTSHGVCYTFNRVDRPEDVLQVQNSGVDYGLKLTLNTEQYEVTAGPHDTTGIKMIATDQSDSPQVDEVGLAISTGTHTFVAIGAVTINNLPPPYGECVKSSLKSTGRYSPESCMLECETNYVLSECDCRHFYMPDTTGWSRLCTVTEYFGCLRGAIATFNEISDKLCDCPAQCFYQIYEPSVSYATSSHLKADLKDDVDEKSFKDRFFQSKEITERLDFEAEKQFRALVTKTLGGLNLLRDSMSNIKSLITHHTLLLDEVNNDTNDAIGKRSHLFNFQSFIVEKNFVRGRDAMEERAFGMACQGFNEFVIDLEYKLSYLFSFNDVNSTEAGILYILMQGALRSRLDTLTEARENYTQLIDAYQLGQFIFNYSYQSYGVRYNYAAVPSYLLMDALTDVDKDTYLAVEDIDRIIDAVVNYTNYINSAFGNDSFVYSQEKYKIKDLNKDFIQACEMYLGKKSIMFKEVVDRPLEMLQKQDEAFTKLASEYNSIYNDISANLVSMDVSVRDTRDVYIPQMREVFAYAMHYLDAGRDDEKSKYDVALKFTDDAFSNEVYKLGRILEDTKRRLMKTSEAWPAWQENINKIWSFIVTDDNIKMFVNLAGWTKFQESESERRREIRHKIGFLPQVYVRLMEALQEADHLVLKSITSIIEQLSEYKAGHDMDEDFYRKNFLQVDVFFKELRSEQIDQQKAYDEFALLCDIGGSMGLFIGGSLITFFEILDFLCMVVVHKLCMRRRV